jgi:hypothetical protein
VRRPSRRRPERGRAILEAVNLRVIAAAVVIASFLLLATALLLLLTRSSPAERGLSTAVMTVIVANTPTFTAQADGAAPGAGAETPLPTPQPGVMSLGAYVQIVGTGGAGLRLRDQPGLAGKVLILGSEAEVFRVEDGPQELDGYTWWYLVGPFDSERRGWAATNYLQIVQGP